MRKYWFAIACCVATLTGCATPEIDEVVSSQRLAFAADAGRLREDPDDAGVPPPTGCGNGRVAWNEECDPAAPGWEKTCDQRCLRTAYEPCQRTDECAGLNVLCAAYGNQAAGMFCADYCSADAMCPQLPGFRSICNFAWCAVRCNEGACPNGMTCLRDQVVLDHNGRDQGKRDICVVLTDR